MYEKKELRKYIKALKQQLSEDESKDQTENIFRQLETNVFFEKAQHILFYWSMSDEVATQEFILKHYQTKHIYLPVIQNDDLDIVLFTGEDSLIPGPKYGIPEPTGDKLENENIIDVVVVPGVAFDNEGNRMGRGAGYYDRILKRVPQAKRIALAYDFQMVNQVPVERHDIPMDIVIAPI